MILKHLDIGIMSKWFTCFFVRYSEKLILADEKPKPEDKDFEFLEDRIVSLNELREELKSTRRLRGIS